MKKLKSKSLKTIKKFTLYPLLLCVLMLLSLLAVSAPFIGNAVSVAGMFMSDKQVDYSKAYDNIFVPTDKDSETVSAEDVEFPGIGKQFGELSVSGTNVDAKLFFGDGKVPLRNGVGIYAGSFIPGYGRTILVAGHNNTFFNGLKNVSKGDVVKISTSYGNYKYTVTGTKLTTDEDKSAYDLNSKKENLILYTCYPFDSIGLTNKRFFVYAEKTSGPTITGLYE
jgi:sortase A